MLNQSCHKLIIFLFVGVFIGCATARVNQKTELEQLKRVALVKFEIEMLNISNDKEKSNQPVPVFPLLSDNEFRAELAKVLSERKIGLVSKGDVEKSTLIAENDKRFFLLRKDLKRLLENDSNRLNFLSEVGADAAFFINIIPKSAERKMSLSGFLTNERVQDIETTSEIVVYVLNRKGVIVNDRSYIKTKYQVTKMSGVNLVSDDGIALGVVGNAIREILRK